jgi:hypothetical protein
MRTSSIVVTLAALTPNIGSGPSAAAIEISARASRPLIAISGADSHVQRTTYDRIINPDDWDSAWASHLGTRKDDAYRSRFEIDFERCMVVVIFRGERVNVRGV